MNIDNLISSLFVLLFSLTFVLVIYSSLLVLLILGYKIVHVGLGFGEFHLVHSLSGVPM